jgi:signal transduction histidine kinase/ActR/RegA family two-component response regulator
MRGGFERLLVPVAQLPAAFRRLVAGLANRGQAQEQARAMAALERRVEAQALALDEAKRALQAETETRRRLETELRQAQKLETIGQLTGGVAHDFNNILMVIQGYADMLLAETGEGGTRRSDLLEIRKAARRGSDLTRQLLAFGRKQVPAVRTIDLNAVLVDTIHMLARLIGGGVKLDIRTATEACHIAADRVQFEQVLINLAVNARDAMSGRGTLTLGLERVAILERTAGLAPGTYARLTVSDTGCGMDAATLARIFDPFFTTKPPGAGSGLGLATVSGVVKQLGGHIAVESTLHEGTTFTVHLPATAQAKPAAPAREQAPMAVSRAHETVLLVEGDNAVREVVGSLLRRHGYEVLQAGAPQDAVTLALQHPRAIDLVLSDVMLPDMTGPEMVARLVERHPAIRTVYLSGYSATSPVMDGVLDAQATLVQKPVSASDLLSAVRRALGSAPAASSASRRAG